MLETGTSGLMSGEGKRSAAVCFATAPFLDSTCALAPIWNEIIWSQTKHYQFCAFDFLRRLDRCQSLAIKTSQANGVRDVKCEHGPSGHAIKGRIYPRDNSWHM
jgi:hypothetical protein